MQHTGIYRETVTDTKYDHEITLLARKWPLQRPKGRTFFYKIYFRVHHGGISAKLPVYNLKGEYPQSQKLQISHQINDKLYILMIKVSKLVCCLPIAYCMQKISYPLQFSRWPPFFKMAATYTEMYDI